MSTPMAATRTYRLHIRPTLRTITVAALMLNALLFLYDVSSSGPNEINLTQVIISLVVAGIAAIRLRWAHCCVRFSWWGCYLPRQYADRAG
jgi:hypothetical protein